MSKEKSMYLGTDHDSGDVLYTGPLDQALVLVKMDRDVRVTEQDGFFHVEFHDNPDLDSAAEWGGASNYETALRYAMGAYFGPNDEHYNEGYLEAALTTGQWDASLLD